MELKAHLARDTGRKLYRNLTPLQHDSDSPVILKNQLEQVTDPGDATLVSSESEYADYLHLPVLDLDYEAQLVPSTTPGHYHLYLDRYVEKTAYMRLLTVLAECGLIEWGFADASVNRGASFVRVPGVRKGEDKTLNEQMRAGELK